MTVLNTNEYDKSYFDGSKATYRHNAGYSKYERWKRNDGENSLGEYWKDYANRLKNTHALQGKKALEIGSAKGFIVEDLREMGVDAYGLDVSQYAYDEASEAVKPYLTVGDARTALSKYRNKEFDVVFSLRFLECISEADLPALVAEMNRISKFQFHLIDEITNQYYIEQPLEWWLELDWNRGTFLQSRNNENKILRK